MMQYWFEHADPPQLEHVVWLSTLVIMVKLMRIAIQTLHSAYPGCEIPRELPCAPRVPSRIVLERRALNSPTNRATRPAIAKKTVESSRQASRPISPWRAVAFHPVSAELAVAPWGGGSEHGGGDEGCVSGGGGEGGAASSEIIGGCANGEKGGSGGSGGGGIML
jgi:hypothetical protein